MTIMDHLTDISIEELRDALADVDRKKPTMRLITAIAYKNGVTQTELADWFGVQRRTIYSWLKRFDSDEPLSTAAADDTRPGRDKKLSASQLAEFETVVRQPPGEVGIDASYWSPPLVQDFLADRYDVEYSIPSCRRLLKEAGLRYEPLTRPEAEGTSGGQDSQTGAQRGGRWTTE